MYKHIGLLLVLSACTGRVAPDEISIDPNFPKPMKVIIGDVLDNWCEAVGWCPARMSNAAAHIFAEEKRRLSQRHARREKMAQWLPPQ